MSVVSHGMVDWPVPFLHTVITNKINPSLQNATASQIQQITYNQSHSPVSSQYIAPVTYSASLFIIAQHTERYSEKTLKDSCLIDKSGQNLSTHVSTQVNHMGQACTLQFTQTTQTGA